MSTAREERIAAAQVAARAEVQERMTAKRTVPGLTFLRRLTLPEYTAIIAAAGSNAQLSLWIDMLRVNGEVDVRGVDALAAKAALVGAGLLTSERANIIFAVL